MQDISLHLLDAVNNSIMAHSRHIAADIFETHSVIKMTVCDDGHGIEAQVLPFVTDRAYTTRGGDGGLGLWQLKNTTEMTGGGLDIRSRCITTHPCFHGTVVCVSFVKASEYCPKLGDVASTVSAILSGIGDAEFRFCHRSGDSQVFIDTVEIRQVIGSLPLSTPAVLQWAKNELTNQYTLFYE